MSTVSDGVTVGVGVGVGEGEVREPAPDAGALDAGALDVGALDAGAVTVVSGAGVTAPLPAGEVVSFAESSAALSPDF